MTRERDSERQKQKLITMGKAKGFVTYDEVNSHMPEEIVSSDQIDDWLYPYTWYKRLVIAGAREHGFPPDHIVEIQRVEARPDPDSSRRARYESLLVQIENAPPSRVAKL